jgi:hypothetical protein
MAVIDALERIQTWSYGLQHLARHVEHHTLEGLLAVFMEAEIAKECEKIHATLGITETPTPDDANEYQTDQAA